MAESFRSWPKTTSFFQTAQNSEQSFADRHGLAMVSWTHSAIISIIVDDQQVTGADFLAISHAGLGG
jgi:hypothetical protein